MMILMFKPDRGPSFRILGFCPDYTSYITLDFKYSYKSSGHIYLHTEIHENLFRL